jgi:Soluble NSF attachment protein, SNAP
MFRKLSRFQDHPLPADQLAILVKANQLMSDNKPSDAGLLFAQVADAMQQSNHPRRAANLYARAAHAFADGSNEQAALGNARKTLTLFTQSKMVRRSPVFFTNITHKMTTKGMNAAADTLQREYGAQLVAMPALPRLETRRGGGLLPTNCPKCGAMVHSDDADWLDDNTIECEYCGSLIRTEQ